MQSTGIVRKIDRHGKIGIPKSLRTTRGIDVNEPVEFLTDSENNNQIIMRKYQVTCEFCDTQDPLVLFKGKKICPSCIDEMTQKMS